MFAMMQDMSKCMGCKACQVACKSWHGLPGEKTTQRGTYQNPPDLDASTYTMVHYDEVDDEKGNIEWLFRKAQCFHCSKAACLDVCPAPGAIFRTKWGGVVIDQEKCIGCKYCIKHVSYQWSLRLRSPENIMKELRLLKSLGINYVQMYADLFTLSRDQVVGLCKMMIDEKINMHWMSNSRVDYVDEEMLSLMAKAGCWMITWGIESGSYEILKRAHKGADPAKAERALTWARKAGIMNWGYFIIGLPGETEETIKQTMAFSKKLPLDIALFHIAAPYPGTPFFYEVAEKGWFRPGTKWEEVDMDESTVLDYPDMPAERLEYWQRRATREWSFRPGPMLTFVKGMNTWQGFKSAVNVGFQMLRFVQV